MNLERTSTDAKDLCAETLSLRETILRRVIAIGCHIDEDSLSEAEAIVDSQIGEFLSAPEYAGARRRLAKGHTSDSRMMTLLVLECVTQINAERHTQRGAARAASATPEIRPGA